MYISDLCNFTDYFFTGSASLIMSELSAWVKLFETRHSHHHHHRQHECIACKHINRNVRIRWNISGRLPEKSHGSLNCEQCWFRLTHPTYHFFSGAGNLFDDLVRLAIFHHNVSSVLTARNPSPVKRDDWNRLTVYYIARTPPSAEHTVDHSHEVSTFQRGLECIMPHYR